MPHNYLQTDQDRCYDTEGKEIPCEGSGQDGEQPKIMEDSATRFEVKESIVHDRNTNLTWTRNANFAEFPLTWQESFRFIEQLNHDKMFGFNDWRLPNRRELRSLMSYRTKKPVLPAGHPFTDIFLGWYWTSTSAAIDPRYAWYIHLEGARMFYGRKDQYYLVWPVRGDCGNSLPQTGQHLCYDIQGNVVTCANTGQDGEIRAGFSWPTTRFIDRSEVVEDTLTGLCWLKNANVTGSVNSWQEALDMISALNASSHAGIGRWRLPNVNELESLVDCSTHSPALPAFHPFVNVQEAYWSSTTSFFETDWAWVLYLHKGALGVGFKSGRTFSVWPVCRPDQK